ncbi:MAG: hypothetical protein ACKV2O_01990 [Acidimicrobiales bacterium]
MSAHRMKVLSRTARGLAAVSVLTLAIIATTGAADAASKATPITDYANYPAALPIGCPDGSGALEDLSFSNGRGSTAWSLEELDVGHGDTVTMSWTSFHDACLDEDGKPAIMVGLAAYDTVVSGFDQNQDQKLVAWSNCGAGADQCASTPAAMQVQTYTSKEKPPVHSLSLTLPAGAPCNVQLDAHLGAPLQVVGPNGSFYSESLRDDNKGDRLVSAVHFTLKPCEEETTTTPSTTPSTTATTAASATTSTASAAPSVRSQSLVRNSPAPLVAAAGATPTTRAQVAQQQLPATGRNSVELLQLAAWLCLAGSAILMVSSAMSRRFLRW